MTWRYDNKKGHDVEEFLKKDYQAWSTSTDSKKSERTIILKTLTKTPWHKMDKVMNEIKATLPYISRNEVRRFYIPFHEAVLLELEEQEYHEAIYYMKELFQLDEKMNEKSPGSLVWKRLYLRDQKDLVDRLKDGLIEFEEARRNGDHVARAVSFLDVALFFQSKRWEWWWVAERLYQGALSAAEYIEDDNCYTITLIRYLYGRFLSQQLQNPKEALDYLNEVRKASEKKTWNASKKLGEEQGSIFTECNILLYKALLILARKERPENPEYALQICVEALQRATEAGGNEYVNEALYELGKSYVAMKDMKRALQSFSKLLALAKRIPDVEGVCSAHMELAFTYKQLDDNTHTEKHLRLFRENAQKFRLFQKLADAHYYTGEHYLSQGKLHLSTVHLESALCLYNRLDLSREADRARSIAGISKGQERIDEYFKLIMRCGERDQTATVKLCEWKSCRKIFWAEKLSDDKSDLEVPYENSDVISSSQSLLNY